MADDTTQWSSKKSEGGHRARKRKPRTYLDWYNNTDDGKFFQSLVGELKQYDVAVLERVKDKSTGKWSDYTPDNVAFAKNICFSIGIAGGTDTWGWADTDTIVAECKKWLRKKTEGQGKETVTAKASELSVLGALFTEYHNGTELVKKASLSNIADFNDEIAGLIMQKVRKIAEEETWVKTYPELKIHDAINYLEIKSTYKYAEQFYSRPIEEWYACEFTISIAVSLQDLKPNEKSIGKILRVVISHHGEKEVIELFLTSVFETKNRSGLLLYLDSKLVGDTDKETAFLKEFARWYFGQKRIDEFKDYPVLARPDMAIKFLTPDEYIKRVYRAYNKSTSDLMEALSSQGLIPDYGTWQDPMWFNTVNKSGLEKFGRFVYLLEKYKLPYVEGVDRIDNYFDIGRKVYTEKHSCTFTKNDTEKRYEISCPD